MKTVINILFCGVIFVLSCSCQNDSDNSTRLHKHNEDKMSYCDSIYYSFYQNDPRLLSMESIFYSKLDSLNQLIQLSDSTQGFFILHFDSNAFRQPLPIRSRFLFLDKQRRQKNPKVGTYIIENYEFQILENQNKIRISSSTKYSWTIDASNSLDTIRNLLINDFLGDSSTVADLNEISFKFTTPIDLQKFKELARFTASLHAELRDTLCAQLDESDPLLKFKIEKLAYSKFEVWYDWWDSFENVHELMKEYPNPALLDSTEVKN